MANDPSPALRSSSHTEDTPEVKRSFGGRNIFPLGGWDGSQGLVSFP